MTVPAVELSERPASHRGGQRSECSRSTVEPCDGLPSGNRPPDRGQKDHSHSLPLVEEHDDHFDPIALLSFMRLGNDISNTTHPTSVSNGP